MIKKIITGKLRALTGIHIGSGNSTEITDSPVHRNVEGDIVIPGTAIAGSLRTLATRIGPHLGFKKCYALDKKSSNKFCKCEVCNLFGSINPDENYYESKASKIWVNDAILESEEKLSIRDGVGIDRETRSSANKKRAKYDFETITKDSVFTFQLAIQSDVDDKEEIILASILTEWEKERCHLGGNAARGLGKMKLEGVKAFKINLSSKQNLMAFLKNDEPIKAAIEEKEWLESKVEKARQRTKNYSDHALLYNSFAQIDFLLKINGGYVINDKLSSIITGFDFSPKNENDIFILPGSSLRGVMRFHAEKIARSIATINSQNLKDFLLKCPACNPFADIGDPLSSCNSTICKNSHSYINEEQFCLACQLFGSSCYGSRLHVNDSYLITSPQIKIMDFLAIDRFTGGGKEGAKFDAVVLWQPSFQVQIFIENPEEWQLGWLMLVLKDIRDGLVSIGFGQNKWFGKATTENETFKIGAISEDLIPGGLKFKTKTFESIFETETFDFDELYEPIDNWIKEFHNKLTDIKRENNPAFASDTYFKDDIFKLYPKKVNI